MASPSAEYVRNAAGGTLLIAKRGGVDTLSRPYPDMPAFKKLNGFALALIGAILLLPQVRATGQEAAAYAVMDGASGHFLLEARAAKKVQVGSLANIATALVVLDWLNLNKRDINEAITIPQADGGVSQNPIGWRADDGATIRDLLYAVLMQSDDMAANALASFVGQALPASGGDTTPTQRFVAQMNALARKLGMKNTLFVNPTGADANEHRLPYSTAEDMARLASNAMNRSQFRFYVSQKEREIQIQHPGGAATQYMLQNTNELLGVDGIDGLRTGTTRRAGPCVILSAARSPESRQEGEKYFITARRLVVVVVGAADRFGTAHQLLQNGWAAFEQWSAAGKPSIGGRG